jgi:hypothetical protein
MFRAPILERGHRASSLELFERVVALLPKIGRILPILLLGGLPATF